MNNVHHIETHLQLLYSDEEDCLNKLFSLRYGEHPACKKCKGPKKFYPVKGRRCFECGGCSHQLYPMKDTIFQDTKLPLKKWFLLIWFMVEIKNGMGIDNITQVTGIQYKAAHKAMMKVRGVMQDIMNDVKFSGVVELDETHIGKYRGKRHHMVFGIKQPKGRKTFFQSCPVGHKEEHLLPIILHHVVPGTHIYTDNHASYRNLSKYGYKHTQVKKTKWRRPMYKGSTINSQESTWRHLQDAIEGTYKKVITKKYIDLYLAEYSFRKTYGGQSFSGVEMILERIARDANEKASSGS